MRLPHVPASMQLQQQVWLPHACMQGMGSTGWRTPRLMESMNTSNSSRQWKLACARKAGVSRLKAVLTLCLNVSMHAIHCISPLHHTNPRVDCMGKRLQMYFATASGHKESKQLTTSFLPSASRKQMVT